MNTTHPMKDHHKTVLTRRSVGAAAFKQDGPYTYTQKKTRQIRPGVSCDPANAKVPMWTKETGVASSPAPARNLAKMTQTCQSSTESTISKAVATNWAVTHVPYHWPKIRSLTATSPDQAHTKITMGATAAAKQDNLSYTTKVYMHNNKTTKVVGSDSAVLIPSQCLRRGSGNYPNAIGTSPTHHPLARAPIQRIDGILAVEEAKSDDLPGVIAFPNNSASTIADDDDTSVLSFLSDHHHDCYIYSDDFSADLPVAVAECYGSVSCNEMVVDRWTSAGLPHSDQCSFVDFSPPGDYFWLTSSEWSLVQKDDDT